MPTAPTSARYSVLSRPAFGAGRLGLGEHLLAGGELALELADERRAGAPAAGERAAGVAQQHPRLYQAPLTSGAQRIWRSGTTGVRHSPLPLVRRRGAAEPKSH